MHIDVLLSLWSSLLHRFSGNTRQPQVPSRLRSTRGRTIVVLVKVQCNLATSSTVRFGYRHFVIAHIIPGRRYVLCRKGAIGMFRALQGLQQTQKLDTRPYTLVRKRSGDRQAPSAMQSRDTRLWVMRVFSTEISAVSLSTAWLRHSFA